MKDFVNKIVTHETWNLTNLLLLGIILAIPFSIRHVFETSYNFQTGAYSDFTSISLYLSEILAFILIVANFSKFKTYLLWIAPTLLWLLVEFLIRPNISILQLYFTWRTIILILMAITIAIIPKIQFKLIAYLFVFLGFLQSLLAIYQFYGQKSLGLYFFGESHLNPNTLGIAKIVAYGTKFVRGYGTFPHSNLLAAFLVISIIFNLYLLTKSIQKYTYLIFSFTLVFNLYGLFITFSRAGILAGILGIMGFCIILVISKKYNLFLNVGLVALLGIVLSAILLFPYLSTRATLTDEAVKERSFYNKIGLNIVKDNPIFGVGPGISVLHMEQYSHEKLQPWQIQPIHNFYLITFAEWGIGGLLFLALIIIPIVWLIKITITKLINSEIVLRETTLSLIGLSILFLFLFDHYFYTIWPTAILLWVMIGLIGNTIIQNKKQLPN